MNHLKIGAYSFKINTNNSYINEHNDDFTKWTLLIETEEGTFLDNYTCAPNIRGENILADFGHLNDLIGKTLYIKEAYNFLREEYLFTLYLQRHASIKENEITIKKIENNIVYIDWKGIIEDLHFGEYDQNTPFELSCGLPIKSMIEEKNYCTPTTKTNECINNFNDDYSNNSELLCEIEDIIAEFTLETDTYYRIIQAFCSSTFLNSFDDNMDDIDFFISEFTYYKTDGENAIPKKIKEKAIKEWGEILQLNDIMENL